jgi:hypothetical protein
VLLFGRERFLTARKLITIDGKQAVRKLDVIMRKGLCAVRMDYASVRMTLYSLKMRQTNASARLDIIAMKGGILDVSVDPIVFK